MFGFTGRVLEGINLAMDILLQETCILMKERTDETEYVNIRSGGGCASYVGYIGRPQDVRKLTLTFICMGLQILKLTHMYRLIELMITIGP